MEGFEDDLCWKKHSQISLLTELEIEMGFLDSLFNLQPTDSTIERNQLGSQWVL